MISLWNRKSALGAIWALLATASQAQTELPMADPSDLLHQIRGKITQEYFSLFKEYGVSAGMTQTEIADNWQAKLSSLTFEMQGKTPIVDLMKRLRGKSGEHFYGYGYGEHRQDWDAANPWYDEGTYMNWSEGWIDKWITGNAEQRLLWEKAVKAYLVYEAGGELSDFGEFVSGISDVDAFVNGQEGLPEVLKNLPNEVFQSDQRQNFRSKRKADAQKEQQKKLDEIYKNLPSNTPTPVQGK